MTDINSQDIAIIGLSGCFPDAENIQKFWKNLAQGLESIKFLTPSEHINLGFDPSLLNNPNYVAAYSAVENIEWFDAAFFNMTPREAECMDPQHRLLLEHCYNALENSGYVDEEIAGRIGIFASVGISHYLLQNLLADVQSQTTPGISNFLLGNDKSYASTRIAHKLNLTGPALTIDTACSSSLVAVVQACKALLTYDCDLALAGGAKINIPQKMGYVWEEGGIFSRDGHCRAFDSQATGTVFGSGVGVVVLKRLSDAVFANDYIYAIIKGSAVNNDGSDKVGFTAPSVHGQTKVIEEALAIANIPVESIGYIETHGTGTVLGDPIEFSALSEAFIETTKKEFCSLGSLKANIGHLEIAAGIASLIKTIFCLQEKKLLPSLNFIEPNPHIDFRNSPFYVNTQLKDWKSSIPRRAGVSSFGIGGTNAHVILEEASSPIKLPTNHKQQLIILSAKTESALKKMAENLGKYLQLNTEISLSNVAYTLQCGRKHYQYRIAFICENLNEAINILAEQKIEIIDSTKIQAPVLEDLPILENKVTHLEFLQQVSYAWLHGTLINWQSFGIKEQHARIPLPTYPFEKGYFWKSPLQEKQKLEKISNWFYVASWRKQVIPSSFLDKDQNKCILLFCEENLFAQTMEKILKAHNKMVLKVIPGDTFIQLDAVTFQINPNNPTDYKNLLQQIYLQKIFISEIFHLWSLSPRYQTLAKISISTTQSLGFYSLLYLAKCTVELGIPKKIKLNVISNFLIDIENTDQLCPVKATLLGPCLVIPIEYSHIDCQYIDIILPNTSVKMQTLIINILKETSLEKTIPIVAIRGQYRWVKDYNLVSLPNSTSISILREQGVYLITGGLGGIGLLLAKAFAERVKAKLILLIRSAFPERSLWDEIEIQQNTNSNIKEKIKKIRAIEQLGSQVLLITADVSNYEQMQNAITQAKAHFGKINGVIHSAGVAGGGVIQIRDELAIKKVFSPKLEALCVFDKLFESLELDFIVLNSSLFSITGGFGQVDYCAANAALDVYAAYLNKKNRFALTINWDGWENVGMTAKAQPDNSHLIKEEPIQIKQFITEDNAIIFEILLDPRKHWELAEHRLMGKCVFPGTGFLNILQKAYRQINPQSNLLSISDVYFIEPLITTENRILRLIFEENARGYQFKFLTQINQEWHEHAHGKIFPLKENNVDKINLLELQQLCLLKQIEFNGEAERILGNNKNFQLGKRWHTLQKIQVGHNQGLFYLKLDPLLMNDLQDTTLHPALLDMATGIANSHLLEALQSLKLVQIPDQTTYIPFCYKKIDIFSNLPADFIVYSSCTNIPTKASDLIVFNIKLVNAEGEVLIDINEFSLKNVKNRGDNNATFRKDNDVLFAKGLIPPNIGVSSFFNILENQIAPQVIITPRNLLKQIEYWKNFKIDTEITLQRKVTLHSRPHLKTEYVLPSTELEIKIAAIFSELLGVSDIGIHDNFFELDGDSLLATQLLSRINQSLRAQIDFQQIFETPTVTGLCTLIENHQWFRGDSAIGLQTDSISEEAETGIL